MTVSTTRMSVLAVLAGMAMLLSVLLVPPAGAAVDVGAGATAATSAGSAAFKYKMFKTPSGNIQCVMLKSGGRWSMRCDVYEHDWTAPPRSRPCEAGDYGSSVNMGGKARPRFICVSDAIGATRVLKYGKKLDYGPFLCKSKRKGLKCWNKRDRGWFLSKQRYRFF